MFKIIELILENFILNGKTKNEINNQNNNWNKKAAKLCGNYVIRHVKTGKVYVGSCNDLYKRKIEHESHLQKGIHINKKFQEAFTDDQNIEWLVIVTENRNDAYDNEQWCLDRFRDSSLLFNIATDARISAKGLKHSLSSINKIKLARSKQIITDIHKEKLRISSTKVMESLEIRNRIRNFQLGRKKSDEAKDKMRKPKSKEHADKIRLRIMKLAKPVSINGVTYDSISHASRHLNKSITFIKNKINNTNNEFKNWYYL